jgi:hypothetical protein
VAVGRPLRSHTRGRSPTAARPSRLCGPPCTRRGRRRRGGAGGHGLPTACMLQSQGRGHEGGRGGVPGKEIGGGAHPIGGVTLG